MILCEKDDCTGCEACRNACPSECISMVESNEGFLCPEIDNTKCAECGQCQSACPVLYKPVLGRNTNPIVYACWHKDKSIRLQSSSGGAFSALAETIMNDGGMVFGATYDKNLHVHHLGIDTVADLNFLRKSKYVQSEIGLSYIEVKKCLQKNKKVLFVGTPCQVAGLYSFLGNTFENLVTCDFICHGVPSPKVFKLYLDWLISKQYNIYSFNFRDKTKGWENSLSVVTDINGIHHNLTGLNNSFYNGFIKGVFLRESCYACQFVGLPRYSDLTLGDFWGIGKQFPFPFQDEINMGISLIMVNSYKGKSVIDKSKNNITCIERSLDEAIQGNTPLSTSPYRPEYRDSFFDDIDILSFDELVYKYLRPSFKSRVRIFAREFLGASSLQLLRKILGFFH